MAKCIRFLSIDAVQQAKSGHPGAPTGMAGITTVLFRDFMQSDASDPHWIDRDRFILSNGHGLMLLYSLLYLTGYKDIPIEELKRFRQVGSKTPNHPEYHCVVSHRVVRSTGIGNLISIFNDLRILWSKPLSVFLLDQSRWITNRYRCMSDLLG